MFKLYLTCAMLVFLNVFNITCVLVFLLVDSNVNVNCYCSMIMSMLSLYKLCSVSAVTIVNNTI